MKIKSLKPLWITLIVVLSFVLLAVVVGVLNATVGGGRWQIGWSSYRYDDTAFEVGGSTVYADSITAIDIDWVNGQVQTIVTDDAYLSISESCEEALSDTNTVRWKVESDGTFTVKFQKSGSYFGSAQKKQLIVRIPKRMLSSITRVTVNSVAAEVSMAGVSVPTLSVKSVSGTVYLTDCQAQTANLSTVSGNMAASGHFDTAEIATVSGAVVLDPAACPQSLKLSSVSGDFRIKLPESDSFRLTFATTSGSLTSDFDLWSEGGSKIFGEGAASMEISTISGDVALEKKTLG